MRRLPMNLAIACLGASVIAASPAAARDAAVPDAAARCKSFEGPQYVGNYAYSQIPDAPTYITSTNLRAAKDALPEFCEINGYIAPQIGFTLRLPTQLWNGKFLLAGCESGFCGTISIASAAAVDALKRGYAVTANDSGHRGTAGDGTWAYSNLQAKLDFAYRATHVNAVVAKQILADFYGRAAQRSYFHGCSTGGRQGLIAAQLFPRDFDGVIAGAPAMSATTSSFAMLWAGLANIDSEGKQILTRSDLQLLNGAALAACDKSDGVADGVFGDARQCTFDPAQLQCKSDGGSSCLSPAKVAAARKIYQGPVDSRGRAIHFGGLPVGSELDWERRLIANGGRPAANVVEMTDWFRYLAYQIDPGPSWQAHQINWDEDPDEAGGLGASISVSHDLREFKAVGGKLIQYHGWQDAVATPLDSVDYFEAVTRTIGGLAATQSFYRLFMIPGMAHCAGGPGAHEVDYLTSLENWVEKGEAPQALSGRNAAERRARPHFPYPDTARYKGSGNADEAESFRRVSGDKSFEQRPLR